MWAQEGSPRSAGKLRFVANKTPGDHQYTVHTLFFMSGKKHSHSLSVPPGLASLGPDSPPCWQLSRSIPNLYGGGEVFSRAGEVHNGLVGAQV